MFKEYVKKRDHWCYPNQGMTAMTFSDATTECSKNVSCHMFVEAGVSGNKFFACENTASIAELGSGVILYQKQGNNLHAKFESFRVIS